MVTAPSAEPTPARRGAAPACGAHAVSGQSATRTDSTGSFYLK